MDDPGSDQEDSGVLNYVNKLELHRGNLRAALDYHAVRDPDLELVSMEGRRLFGHRAVLGIFSQMLAEVFSYIPCCQKSSLMFPDTSSEVLSHLLNVLYTGSTETSSDKVELLCGPVGVFATAKQLGISIKSDQKVIEVVDKPDPPKVKVSNLPHLKSIHDESLDIADEAEDDNIVVEGEEEPETMEITPQIPMFDLSHFLYQAPYQSNSETGNEEGSGGSVMQVENEDYYICKLPNCQAMIQFENCGARSKILNHYTSHFQRELELDYSHLLTQDMACSLCGKELKGAIKSKVWIHIGVTHDKTNEILQKKGIEPIRVNIRMNKRKASDAFKEETSPTLMLEEERSMMAPVPRLLEYPSYNQQLCLNPGQVKVNTCKICGQVTQNRKRLLKHYCTRHYIDRLSLMEFTFMEKNRCVICQKDFVGAKKSSKVIHIGLEHKKIFDILDEEFGKDGYLKHDSSTPLAPPPLKKIKTEPQPQYRPIAPKLPSPTPQPVPSGAPVSPGALTVVNPNKMTHLPRIEASMSERMKEIQDLGNTCYVCGKQFDLFRSMLLPHYCGHFYKEIAQGHEDYFTEVNCKLCGATATKRKSRIIHLGVKHELVLPFINEVLKSRNLLEPEAEEIGEADIEEVEEEEPRSDEFVIDESEMKSENDEPTDMEDRQDVQEGVDEDVKSDPDEPEPKVVTPLRIKTLGLKFPSDDADSGTDVSEDGMTICKEEKAEQVNRLNNKDVWITPDQTKTETLSKIAMQQNNVDNQDKPYHLEKMFISDSAVNGVAEEIAEGREEEEEDYFEDEVTPENLGLVCKICAVTESSDHELLTHYCSHFDAELKDISGKMINEDHKCVDCHKMLGNNKRRLYHFGVKHLKVIPLINQKLRSLRTSLGDCNEDDFEITYDNQPVKNVEDTPVNNRSLLAGNHLNSKVGGHKNPRSCEMCGCKRNTHFNLLLHVTKQHFLDEIRTRWGQYIVGQTCQLCNQKIDISVKNVGEAEKWIHLGHKHGKTNQLLRENSKTMIIIRGYNDQDMASLEAITDKVVSSEAINNISGGFQSSEDDFISSPASVERGRLLPALVPLTVTEYNCPLCDKTTKNQNLLDLHLIAIHFKKELLKKYGNPDNKCDICLKVFQNVDAYTFHVGKDHNLLKDIMQQNLESDLNPKSALCSPVSISKIITNEIKPTPKVPIESFNSFECFKCGAKRRGMKELYGHYSLQHFSAELKEEFGVHKQCTFEDCNRNLENGTAWISHLGQEHPQVLNKHIPEKYWQSSSDDRNRVENESQRMFKCPLKCSSSFSDKAELMSHFKAVHGFSPDIIQKVLRAHPDLNGPRNGMEGGKKIEA